MLLKLIDHPGYSWFVMHTKSRQEKILANDLRSAGIHCFLPLARRIRYYGNRKVSVEEPIFPGYLFLLGTTEHVYSADRTKRVANIIRVTDQEKLDWELGNLQSVLASPVTLDPFPYLKKGTRVEVRSGPMRGLQGIVEDKSSTRLILQIETLGQAVSLEIAGSLLDPID